MNLKKGKFLGAIVLSLFLLSSCRSLKNTNTLFLSKYDKFADTAKNVYVVNENLQESDSRYKIKPFDIISVRNLQNPDGLGRSETSENVQSVATFRVDDRGMVTLPVVGSINISGLSQADAKDKIQNVYANALLKDPIIELTIVNLQVTLLGEVSKPGNYQLEDETLDLIELLGRSGGINPTADVSDVKIIRGDRRKPEIIYVNLKNINSLASPKLVLRDGDIIYIPAKGLSNLSEGIRSYSTLIQPAILILNAFLLIYSFGR